MASPLPETLNGSLRPGPPVVRALRHQFGVTTDLFHKSHHAKKQIWHNVDWARLEKHAPLVRSTVRRQIGVVDFDQLSDRGKAFANAILTALRAGDETEGLVPAAETQTAADGDAPPPLSLDDAVLRFEGYFTEAAPQTAGRPEPINVRRVVIVVYPTDDTIAVHEPLVNNSGMRGGMFLRRSRVDISPEQRLLRAERTVVATEPFLTMDDLRVGQDVWIHNRRFHVTDADTLTRRVFAACGVQLAPPQEVPQLSTEEGLGRLGPRPPADRGGLTHLDWDLKLSLEALSAGQSAASHPGEVMKLQRFLADDGNVCCFKLWWDDSDNPHGDVREFEAKYFVCDDTVSIRELPAANTGRNLGLFLARALLPRSAAPSGMSFKDHATGTRPGSVQLDKERYYTLDDFVVGKTVEIFGRKMEICDATAWTRQFFEERLGIQQPPAKLVPREAMAPPKGAIVPAHSKIGREEDSLATVHSLRPSAPKADLGRWRRFDRQMIRCVLFLKDEVDERRVQRSSGFGDEELACTLPKLAHASRGRMVAASATGPSSIIETPMRRFVLTYYLTDSTLQIVETAARNSGHVTAKFLQRQRVKRFANVEGVASWYAWSDFFVGAELSILSHRFVVVLVDGFSRVFRYLPENLPPRVDGEAIAAAVEMAGEVDPSLSLNSDTRSVAFALCRGMGVDPDTAGEHLGWGGGIRDQLAGAGEAVEARALIADLMMQFWKDHVGAECDAEPTLQRFIDTASGAVPLPEAQLGTLDREVGVKDVDNPYLNRVR